MSNETSKIPEVKADPIDLLTLVAKQNSTAITDIKKTLEDLAGRIKKAEDANPVAHGHTLEAIPKSTDAMDVGAKVEATNAYGHSQQASIIESQNPEIDGTDAAGHSSEVNKKVSPVKKEVSEIKKEPEPDEKDEKKEVKKESEEKKEEEKKKEEKVEKSLNDSGFTYQVVQPVRPSIIQKSFSNKPTGYQILKAMEDGWGKKTTDANTAYEETIARLVKGEFGTGAPGESDI